ncbi:alpha/beta hydrolase family protein [Alsobacter sp. R-9]
MARPVAAVAGAVLVPVLGLLLAAGAVRAQARAPEFVQESGFLPVTVDGATVRLETMTVRLAGPATPRPIAIITHGKPAGLDDVAVVHASSYRAIARDLARRGWLAVVVVRRGFGLSEGELAYANLCRADRDLGALFRRESDDLAAVLSVVSRRKDADPGRAIAIGVSAGGAVALALAARPPRGLRAVINVSGGLRLNSCPYEERLVRALVEQPPKVPTLWIYARNDQTFPPPIATAMHAGVAATGADARMVMLDPVGEDGHMLFTLPEGRTRWLAALDAFLRDLGLPTLGESEIDAIMAAGLEPQQRQAVTRYVGIPGEKAMARPAGGGKLNWYMGAADVAQARRLALEQCQKSAPQCEIVAENNRLVLGASPPAPAKGSQDRQDARPLP